MQRGVQIAGQQVVISVLGAPLEPLFERFYEDAFGQRPLPWDEIAVLARNYFDQNPTSPAAHDAYFNNFISLWRIMLQNDAVMQAEHLWERALEPAIAWEQAHPGQRLHKGTPYYFWAMTAILRRDMDRGYLIIHKAVQEDVATHGQQTPDTPGYALVSLDHEKLDQAFRAWVLAQAQYVEQLLANYQAAHARALTLAELRRKFLTNPPTIDTLFLFTYTIARFMNITELPEHVRMNPFGGQLELNLFFDITLVIDSAIKEKNTTQCRFICHAEHLLRAMGHVLNAQQLGEINGLFINDFDATLVAALDGTLILPGTSLDRVQCDVALAYGIRNYGAHNTDAAPTIWNRFSDIQQTLFRVLFATIDYLY